MTLEGHNCWEECDEGPHGCVCGNGCEPPPLPLDPLPWSVGSPIDGRELRAANEPTQPVEWADFDPRPGYSQRREDYA